MLQINTNIPALTGVRTLSKSATSQAQSIERLSTGFRINRASDDPSGLVISEKLRSQINGLGQAINNTQNDINLINTAEAALQEVSDILVGIRSSIVFAMNSGFSIPEQIDAEQDKIDQSLLAIDRIAQSTRFAKRNLLNGDADFVVEQSTTHAAALDSLTVRQARMNPSTSTQTFSVNVTKLAERGVIVTNKAFASTDRIASLAAGGNTSDFVTMRLTGANGSEDLSFGSQATVQDLINAINQNATSTGVYASTFQALPLNSTRSETIIDGLTGTLDLGAANDNSAFTPNVGSYAVIGVELNGTGAVSNVVISDSAGTEDGNITAAEFATSLNAVFGAGAFTVDTDAAGTLRITNNNGDDFEIKAAKNTRQVTYTAAQLATFNDLDGDASLELTIDFGDGGGAMAVPVAVAASAAFGAAADDAPELLDQIFGAMPAGVTAHFTAAGDLVLTGDALGSTTGTVILEAAAAGDAGSVTQTVQTVGSDTAGLSILGIPTSGVASAKRGVEFANFSVGASHINAADELALDISLFTTNTDFRFAIFDSIADAAIDVTITDTDGDGFISLSEFNTQLQADLTGGGATGTAYEAFFTKDKGLTIVYDNIQETGDASGQFQVRTHSSGEADLLRVTGLSSRTSESNAPRLALYSAEFGGDQVISLQDVTSATSTLTLRSFANNGLQATADGREGLGVFNGDTSTMRDVRGASFNANGANVEGTVNGLSFTGSGFDVQLVTSALDMKMRLAETFGMYGSVGRTAEAVGYGLKSTVGGTVATSTLAGGTLPDGVLEHFQFLIRQNFTGGSRGTSGLRFQIREGNSATDSMTIGIKGVSTGQLGIDLDPESSDGSSMQRVNSLNGGRLNTLRSGGGNDLFTNPENALKILDAAIDQVADLRAFLGSVSSDTLQRNLNSASVAMENLISSESQIRDVDFAQETTELVRNQVLYASGISVLATANQIPTQLLQLLQ